EGSVRRAGDRLRVTAQLIEAETGGHLWAERWDRTMADLFDVQDELTSAIVTGVEPELGAHERTLSRKKPTENLTAWELAQRGYSKFFEYTQQGVDDALELYNQAMRIDPQFAFVHALAARVHFARVVLGWTSDLDMDVSEGLRVANLAVDLDPKSDYGHVMRGGLLAIGGRFGDAEDAFAVAERLNPNSVVLYVGRGVAETLKVKPDADLLEAVGLKALRLSPNDPQAYTFHNLIMCAELIRNSVTHNDASLKSLELACRYANVGEMVLMSAATACVQLDRVDDAAHYLKRAMRKAPNLTAAVIEKRWEFFPWFEVTRKQNLLILGELVKLGLPEA
ncbi:MAG: hypothetical protein AB8B51_15465, partial [Sedimentitalea sp.]